MAGCCSKRSMRLKRINTRKATAAANKAAQHAQKHGIKPKKSSAKKASAKKASAKKANCRVCGGRAA